MTEARTPATGLDGVVIADTHLSDVDGALGRLVIAGHDVETLAFTHTFTQTAALLWGASERDVARALGEGRAAAHELLQRRPPQPDDAPPDGEEPT